MDIGAVPGVSPEMVSAGGAAVLTILAIYRRWQSNRNDDLKDRQEIKFRGDILRENRELRARADRFAHERNEAIKMYAQLEAKFSALETEVSSMKRRGGDQ